MNQWRKEWTELEFPKHLEGKKNRKSEEKNGGKKEVRKWDERGHKEGYEKERRTREREAKEGITTPPPE